MMKKVLVLGASGMAGHIVYTYLKEKNEFELAGTTNSVDFDLATLKVDIFDIESLVDVFTSFKPDFVINCVGMLLKGAKNYPDKTIYANSYFPHLLSRLSFQYNFKLIHISTDCVFSGKQGGYTEDSFKDATDIYGLSKSLGEIVDNDNITIRTSIIGPEIKNQGEGLFHWFMQQKGEVNGYRSNIWSGVTTLELAKFIYWIITSDHISGLFHLTNNDSVSKYDLLALFNKVYNRNVLIIDAKDYVCDKSFINTNNNVNYIVPSYENMILEQKVFMDIHKLFYEHYS